MAPRLTIVLPLKGRAAFTLRFLWHANACHMPYRFLIADGDVRPAMAAFLTNAKEAFPNLDIEYVQYPADDSFARYYAKMADAIARARTPYVMLADNDDFLVASGIERSLDFLDANAGYVSAGGGIAGFSVYTPPQKPNAGLTGPFNKFTFRYAVEDRSQDLGQASLTERLVAGAQYSWGFYAVYRQQAAAQIWQEAAEIDFSDLMLLEWFLGLRTLTLGRAFSDASSIAYLRQYWTSMRSSFTQDWVHHLLRSRFTADFKTVIDRLSETAAEADGIDRAEAAERLRETFDNWYRGFLRHNYGPSGILRKYLRENLPGLLNWLKTRRRYSASLERKRLLQQLGEHGASAGYLDAFGRELAAIDDLLTGDGFASFFHAYQAALAGAA
jgi:glycosyltransferase domain-containing protein